MEAKCLPLLVIGTLRAEPKTLVTTLLVNFVRFLLALTEIRLVAFAIYRPFSPSDDLQ